jgi:hypothetical protein
MGIASSHHIAGAQHPTQNLLLSQIRVLITNPKASSNNQDVGKKPFTQTSTSDRANGKRAWKNNASSKCPNFMSSHSTQTISQQIQQNQKNDSRSQMAKWPSETVGCHVDTRQKAHKKG